MAPKKGGGNRGQPPKKTLNTVPDSDYIVFGDGKKSKKGNSAKDAPKEEPPGPPKPTVKQVIGGASWTGKLPVNLLSEHCQRVKWNKPEYDMRQVPGKDGAERMYRSSVTLSKTDPKTRETVTVPALRLPQEHMNLSDEPSALEARHFAAAYALFRISSMKNIHMTLPPKYRDLWKGEFTRLKKEDVAEGRAWKYDEDPFAADAKRQEIQKSIEKRKQEQQKKQEAEFSGNISLTLPVRTGAENRIWEKAPKAEMGPQIRSEIEQLIRQDAVWNPYNIKIANVERKTISAELTKLGFRQSHVEEALEFCKDKEEVIEWLMIHVPEDDLPSWALPPAYSAGVTLASGDLVKESKLRNLASAGYSADLCAQALRDSNGDAWLAARALQASLIPEINIAESELPDSFETWTEEVQALEAVYGEKFNAASKNECAIASETIDGQPFSITFQCPPSNYPQTEVPVISIQGEKLPAYIRLSAVRQAIIYAYENLLGDMMMYNICQWLEGALPQIIEHPGRLSELNLVANTPQDTNKEAAKGKAKAKSAPGRQRQSRRRQREDTRTSTDILNDWESRQKQPPQVSMISHRQKLPAWSKKEHIVQAISDQQVTIISGETGSGKSTQVVQFILDDAIGRSKGATVNILCTQPRRVATLSLADRVSSERCSPVGDEVGYIIRGESKVSERTKITFMTTGVLLRRLQGSDGLSEALQGISHIFIDEVHERSLDTDFLLALLRDCLKAHPSLKIVLMSATLDAEVFANYFGGLKKVALVHIEGRTYPVTDLYLDDVLSRTRFGNAHSDGDPGKAIQALGMGINYDLIRDLVDCIDNELADLPGAILIFLPGTMEIDRCLRSVSGLPKVLGLPLHASLLPAEQRKVFPPAPAGRRKVVAATNVAETSITIEDIVAVIDTGRVKETNYDSTNNIVRLEEVWASQAACKQRRGRAGRVRAGTCYKLFTRNTELKMPSKPLPEIQRVPLEQLCLSVKATGAERDVAQFLSQTLTPPDSSAVSNAIKNLHVMGALEANQLTALGVYLSLIPADLRCAKLLVFGALFGILEPCLTIASILTVKSPFVSPRDKRDEANEARLSFPSSHGDLVLDMAAFDEWTAMTQQARYREVQDWCSSKFLSQQTLRDISSTRRQLLDSLKDASLVPWTYQPPSATASNLHASSATATINDTNQCLLLRALIAASLQPQIAVIQLPSKKYISSMSGAKELDPEAKTIKFFIPAESSLQHPQQSSSTVLQIHNEGHSDSDSKGSRTPTPQQSRIFVHPSSSLFTTQSYTHHATHLSYFTKMQTTKSFIRDLTPLNVYSLLLFGGGGAKVDTQTSSGGLMVGGVWRVQGWARIGVLVGRLRVLLDEELRRVIEEGSTREDQGATDKNTTSSGSDGTVMGSMSRSKIAGVVKRLLILNGQDM